MSFLQDLMTKGQSLLKFTKSVNSVVGIDIGTSALKVVQVRRDGAKIKLETYGEIGLGSYANDKAGRVVTLPPETIAKAIADLLRESNVTTKSAVISIQSQATLIFLLELPEVSDSELSTIIPNEARKYIPVPLTEVSLDWYKIPRKETYEQEATNTAGGIRNKMEIVVVAVRNETLSQYAQIADKSGVESRGNEIEIFSAIRSLFHREITPTMVVDCGAGTTKVSIVEYGVVRAYHVINRGSAFVSESLARTLGMEFDRAEELKKSIGLVGGAGSVQLSPGGKSIPESDIARAIETDTQYVLGEIQTILLGYERQSSKSVSKIILCGGASIMPGFLEKVASSFGVEVVYGDPFDKAEAPEFMLPVLKKAGPEFTVAMGLALKDFI